MERVEVEASTPISTGENKMESTIESRNSKYIKVVESDASANQPNLKGANVTRVEPNILEYVRKQMHRATANCEVIGQATLFQLEMDREMSIIEEQLAREAGFEEEAFGVRW